MISEKSSCDNELYENKALFILTFYKIPSILLAYEKKN